jgi:ABC-type amino acid transport system permease subunit
MLDRFSEWILSTVNSVPILLGAGQQQAEAMRAVAAVLLIILIVYFVVMFPFRAMLSKIARRVHNPHDRSIDRQASG